MSKLVKTNKSADKENTTTTKKRGKSNKSQRKICRESYKSSTSCSDYEEWRQELLNASGSSLDDICDNEFQSTDAVFLENNDMLCDGDDNIRHEYVDPLIEQLDTTDDLINVSMSKDDGAGCSKDVDYEFLDKTLEISPSTFVVVELLYDENTKKQVKKKFIAQVQNIVGNNITCRFLRCFSAIKGTYIFPEVEDVMTVDLVYFFVLSLYFIISCIALSVLRHARNLDKNYPVAFLRVQAISIDTKSQ